MIKKQTRQVQVEERTVTIRNEREAAEIVADYMYATGWGNYRTKYGATTDKESQALAYAAAAFVLSYLAKDVDGPTLAKLGVKRVPDSPAEPTWTSSDGASYRVREMPTKYLEYIKPFAFRMNRGEHGRGLFDAICRELDKREREAA